MTALTTAGPLPKNWDRSGLPSWSYFNEELLELEKDLLFRRHWQVVGHACDIKEPGAYLAFDFVGERGLIVRGQDNVIRAFHNLCRHRGSRVVGDDHGVCKSSIVCPFHGWVYNLDGTLRSPSQPKSLPDLDPVEFGLKSIECEIWNGFIFVRFAKGPQPSIAEIMSRFGEELAPYNLSALEPTGERNYAEKVPANWKCVRDVDNEGYHVPMAHPGLDDLFGSNYFDEPFEAGASRSFSKFRDTNTNRLWSVDQYRKMLPQLDGLDDDHKNAWLFIGVFPNFVFGIYPDSVFFYQEFPLATGECVQRGATYKHPDEDRQMRAARYLSGRIDRITSKEDEQLIKWCWESTFSSGYDGVILSDLEYGVRSYHDALRVVFPVLNEEEPARGTLAARNLALLQQMGVAAE